MHKKLIAILLTFSSIIEGQVFNGIDSLVEQDFAPLKEHTIGLITNHTGHDRQRNPTIDLLAKASGVKLQVLFSPEHGLRGMDDKPIVSDTKDEVTGLPVYSLYNQVQALYAPKEEQLKGVTALVFDIQDIGCRFYTYISTLGYCLEAAAKAGLAFFVLDRVNPINGIKVEGPSEVDTTSIIAYHSIPVMHGMTVGELALLFNKEKNLNAQLSIIKIEGWQRDRWFDQTGLPWTNPSPSMRNLTAATLYPGIGLLEYSISVGRGTDTPFEIVGAPYINDTELASELTKANLIGVTFTPIQFTPKASIFKDQLCKGVYITVLNREAFSPIDVGITIAATLYRLYPKDFNIEKFNTLLCNAALLKALKEGKSSTLLKEQWAEKLNEFNKRRANYLLY